MNLISPADVRVSPLPGACARFDYGLLPVESSRNRESMSGSANPPRDQLALVQRLRVVTAVPIPPTLLPPLPDRRGRIANAMNLNNSDIDFCEWQGRLTMNYSWGNQQGTEHLASAVYDGSLRQFLEGWFPKN